MRAGTALLGGLTEHEKIFWEISLTTFLALLYSLGHDGKRLENPKEVDRAKPLEKQERNSQPAELGGRFNRLEEVSRIVSSADEARSLEALKTE